MAGQDIKKRLAPGQPQQVNVGGDYIFLKFADRPVDIVITGGRSGGTRVTMEAGDKYRPGRFDSFEVQNNDQDNPAQVILTVGEGDYNRQIVQGEVTVTPGLRKADGSFVPDTRHDIGMTAMVTDDTVQTFSQNESVVDRPYGDINYDANGFSAIAADDQYLYILTATSVNKVTVVDLFTLEIVAVYDHDFYADGIGSFKGAVVHNGRLYAAAKANSGSTWKGPAGSSYSWHAIVSWPISRGGIGSIQVHADGWSDNTTLVSSVLRNIARDSWLVQRDSDWVEVASLTRASIDAAVAVMTEAPSSYGDTKCFYVTDEQIVWADGQMFDAATLENLGSRGIGQSYSEQGIAYSAATGLFYLHYSSDFIGRSWKSGNKWAGAINVSAQCTGARGTRKRGTVLRMPVSYQPGDWGPEFSGPLIRAALKAYHGEAPPDDYLDHIYKLVITEGFKNPRTIVSGTESFDRANVEDDFTVTTPLNITLTIDNQLFNGE